jgi:hypothetical protein
MNENNIQAINEYMDWLQDKRMFPPRGTPEEWLEEVLNKEARTRLNLIAEYFDTAKDPSEIDVIRIQELVFDPIEQEEGEDDTGV